MNGNALQTGCIFFIFWILVPAPRTDGTTLTEKSRTANYVTVTTVYASIPGMSNVSNNILITGLKEYLKNANSAKLWADKNKSKEVSPDAVEGEKEYFIVN